MRIIDTLAEAVTDHGALVIVLFLVTTAGIGFGVTMVESESSLDQFEADTDEAEALDYVDTHFSGEENETTTQIIIRDDGGDGDVLTRDAYIELFRYEQDLRDNETVADALVEEDAVVGIHTLVATSAIAEERVAELEDRRRELNETATELELALTELRENPNATVEGTFETANERSAVELTDEHYDTYEEAAIRLETAENRSQIEGAYRLGTYGVLEAEYDTLREDRKELESGIAPSTEEQIEQLESMNDSEVDAVTERALAGDSPQSDRVLRLLPTGYEPGTAEANATLLLVTLEGESGAMAPGNAPEEIVDAELAMSELADGRSTDLSYRVFGDGIITDEIDASMTESLLIVAPFAFLFVLIVLAIAYRDPLDILLGLFGIVLVLVWTIGFMGWMDVAFNQLFIAVPVLLIGLSIDYAIHVFMRHREARGGGDGNRGSAGAMRSALSGVGVALVFVTATAAIGFLANLASPLGPIREFGVVSAVGILSAFLIFGGLIPALKTELDGWLESRRFDRRREAFGTEGGSVALALAVGSTAARKAPYVVIVLAILLSAGGVYGATNVDTSFQTKDFLADEPPDWTDDLPEVLEPTNYTANSSMAYLNDQFVRDDTDAEILFEGDITDSETLVRLKAAEERAAEKNVTATIATGDAAITSPLSEMNRTAAENESFNATLIAADTTGDGIPDTDLETVYDEFYEASPERAETVIHRTNDGEYEAMRMVVSVHGDADGGTVTEQMREVADEIDGDGRTATATGQVILNSLTEDELFETVVSSLTVSLFAVLLFLMATYRRIEGSASLGAVTMLPVLFTVTWILGTMYLLDIPFNIVTGMITSLTIGLGVAYSIHLTERYNQELARHDSVWEAMETSITGTGGALLGSAATTAGGFGVLVVAFLPFLQQFGLITALMIGYAFLASVLVLPSLLVVWTRLAGPKWTLDDFGTPAADEPRDEPDSSWGNADPEGATVEANRDWEEPFVPAVSVDREAVGTRTVNRRYVEPGETVSVELTVPAVSDRLLLWEAVDTGSLAIEAVSAPTADTTELDGTLYAAIDARDVDRVRLAYELSVPVDVDDGESIPIDGALVTPEREQEVDGDDTIVVVEDLFERILAIGAVTDADLDAAGEKLERGELDESAFETIYRKWLRGFAIDDANVTRRTRTLEGNDGEGDAH